MKSVLITSSVLILVIAALRPVLRGRFRPQIQYALWLIVALRLLVPVELAPSAYSALALLERGSAPARVAEAIGRTTIPAQSYDSAHAQVIEEYQQRGVDTAQLTPSDLADIDAQARTRMQGPTLSQLAAKYARPVWLGGAALTALWFLLVNLRLRRKLRRAELIAVEPRSKLPVFLSDALPSPCLCGALRPAIYVTPAAAEDPDRMRHVLAHEATHYRHWDHWWAWVRCLCLCLYWFDPLVWWAAAMSRQDCELACDAGAIRRLGEEERLPYGRTLVAMIAAGRTPLLQTATTMSSSKRRVRERVKLIARRPKTAVVLTLAAALLMGLAVGCTFTSAPKEPADLSVDGGPSQDPEPLSSNALNTATLPARLLDVPEELRDHVEAASEDGSLAVYYFKKPGEELIWEQYLLIVNQYSQERFDELFDGSPSVSGGSYVFARGNDRYYVLNRNTSIEYDLEDEELFNTALRAVSDYAQKTVLETEGVEPFNLEAATEPGRTIQAAVNTLYNAPSVEFRLSTGGASSTSRAYSVDPSHDGYGGSLVSLASHFELEPFDWGTTEDPQFPPSLQDGPSLTIDLPDHSVYLRVLGGTDLIAVHDPDNGTNWYHGRYLYEGWIPTPYDFLRNSFDSMELYSLRSTSVPDRGQSHQEIAQEWTEGWEGVMTDVVPDSDYACTYVRVERIRVDLPEFTDGPDFTAQEALEEFCEARDMPAEEFGKTWFGFCYDTVFVPVDQSEASPMWAGNTRYYEGDNAPEGALVYSHVGYLRLIDGNWVCEGVGTGW